MIVLEVDPTVLSTSVPVEVARQEVTPNKQLLVNRRLYSRVETLGKIVARTGHPPVDSSGRPEGSLLASLVGNAVVVFCFMQSSDLGHHGWYSMCTPR